MKIILASPRGFCAGVNMAVESLELAIESFGPPVYVYHEIVHNKYVVESFRNKGAVFVDELSEVPEGSNLLFSAHGVSPEIRKFAKERQLLAIDATCPLTMEHVIVPESCGHPLQTLLRPRLPVPVRVPEATLPPLVRDMVPVVWTPKNS